MRTTVGWMLALAATAGCGARGGGATTEPAGPSGPSECVRLGEAVSPAVAGLDATILVFDCDPGPGVELLLNGRIWNHSAASVPLMALALNYPMLAFEVRDGSGAAVHGGPPPVPPAEDPSTFVIDLAPNADYMWDAALDGVIAVDLAPGTYEIRLVYENAVADRGWWTGRLETPWVRFELP
jgi:hypothetical protein